MAFRILASDNSASQPVILEKVAGVWQAMATQPTWGSSPTHCAGLWTDGLAIVASDDNGNLLHHYDPDTDTWTAKARPSAGNVLQFSGGITNSLHAITSSSEVWKFSGGPWSVLTTGLGPSVRDIAAPEDDRIYVVGGTGGNERFWRYDGVSWTNIFSTAMVGGNIPRAVFALSRDLIYASDRVGRVWEGTADGTSWSLLGNIGGSGVDKAQGIFSSVGGLTYIAGRINDFTLHVTPTSQLSPAAPTNTSEPTTANIRIAGSAGEIYAVGEWTNTGHIWRVESGGALTQQTGAVLTTADIWAIAVYSTIAISEVAVGDRSSSFVDQRGGDLVTLTGRFPLLVDLSVAVDGIPAYGGEGFGIFPQSQDGTTLKFVAPPHAIGTVEFTVSDGDGGPVAANLIYVENSWPSKSFDQRLSHPPWSGIGRRRLDTESPL